MTIEPAAPAHALTIDAIESGYPVFGFACTHTPYDPTWAYRGRDGEVEPHWMPGDCWFHSWWEALGSELLDLGPITRLPHPVRPAGDWSYDDGGRIVDDCQV